MNSLEEWKEKLRAEGIRCTKQRVEILSVLVKHGKPLTAKEIYQQLEASEVNLRLSTIYRTLNKLEDNNLAKKLNIGNEESKFELIGAYHHHHLICRNCNQIIALDCPLQEYEKKLGTETGYKIQEHSIKFYGVCPDCQDGHRNI